MDLIIGQFYKLNFNVGGKILTYTGKITSISENFVTFIDKFKDTLTYNLNTLISFEEVKNGD